MSDDKRVTFDVEPEVGHLWQIGADASATLSRHPLRIETQFQVVGVDLAQAGRDETASVTLRRKVERPDRTAIDALLAEDARCYPAFAMARRAAVMEADERVRTGSYGTTTPDSPHDLVYRRVLRLCREYEDMRGGLTRPSVAADKHRAAQTVTFLFHALGAYESHRGARVDVYQERPTPEQEHLSEDLERWGS